MGNDDSGLTWCSGRELERLRRRAPNLAWQENTDQRWLVDTWAATAIVRLFSRLRVIPGMRLVTLATRETGGGNGWTFVLPDDVPLPDQLEIESADGFAPQPPEGALANVMDGITGDGSLRSFVQASILARELEELGAFWHGIEWATHSLLDRGENLDGARYVPDFAPGLEGSGWTWTEKQPADLRPFARREGSEVTVCFWTYSALGQQRIVRHLDTYRSDSLTPVESSAETIATGSSGFIF